MADSKTHNRARAPGVYVRRAYFDALDGPRRRLPRDIALCMPEQIMPTSTQGGEGSTPSWGCRG
jgi:hypothetical protein